MKKILLILLIPCFISCADDDILTEGELNARRLEAILNQGTVDLIVVTWTEGGNAFSASYPDPNYEINGSFFQIRTDFSFDYYNLAKLKRISDWDGGRIDLDFE